MSSSHPDPRHVWKGGPVSHTMTAHPGSTGQTGKNARSPIPLQTSIEKSTSGPPLNGQFSRKGPKGPQSDPKGAQESPRALQGIPNRAKGSTKEGPVEPNGFPEPPPGPAGTQKGVRRNPINKNARSNAPRGRYGIRLLYCYINKVI